MSYGVRIKERNRDDLWSSSLPGCLQYDWFWFGVREGMLEVYCWLLLVGGWAAFPQFPQSSLMTWLGWHTPKACDPNPDIWNTGVNWGPSCLKCCPDHFGSLGISLTLTCGPCSTTSRYTVDWGSLSQTSSVIMGIGVTRSSSVHPPSPTASMSETLECCWGWQPSAWLFGFPTQRLLQQVWWSWLT